MNVLVTGGRGFVGMNVARALAGRGATVWIADRGPRDAWIDAFLAERDERINHLTVDLSNKSELLEALPAERLDAVVHAAVVTATTEEVERNAARDIVDSNVGGTIEALQTAIRYQAQRFVYISSPSAIGDTQSEGLVREDIIPHPNTLYGITKYASEQIVDRWAQLHDLDAASVRIAQPYGPGERATGSRVRTSPIWEWLKGATDGEELLTGPFDRARDWTYVEDTAEGIARMVFAERLPQRIYHLGTGRQASVGAVIEALTAAFGPLECDVNPGAAGLNPNISGPGRPPLDVGRFEQQFGWKPETGIADGMERYFNWWGGFSKLDGIGTTPQ